MTDQCLHEEIARGRNEFASNWAEQWTSDQFPLLVWEGELTAVTAHFRRFVGSRFSARHLEPGIVLTGKEPRRVIDAYRQEVAEKEGEEHRAGVHPPLRQATAGVDGRTWGRSRSRTTSPSTTWGRTCELTAAGSTTTGTCFPSAV